MKANDIFTAITIVGVVATAITVHHAALKADKILDEKRYDILDSSNEMNNGNIEVVKKELSIKEKVRATWKCYIVPGVVISATVLSALAGNHFSKKAIAAAGVVGGGVALNRDKLQKRVEELKKEYNDYIRSNQGGAAEWHNETIEQSSFGGDLLCYNSYDGRMFRCSRERVDSALKEWNNILHEETIVNFNTLYQLLGIRQTGFGYTWGYADNSDLVDEEGIKYITELYEDGFLKTIDPWNGESVALDVHEPIYVIDVQTYPIMWYEEF